eukprot:jgi/Ulvmu1/2668/UM014_0124.1
MNSTNAQADAQVQRCSVIFARKCAADADRSITGVAVYNAQLLQQLFSILGLKMRHAKALTDSLLRDLSLRMSNASADGFEGSSCHPRPDGSTAICIHRSVLRELILKAMHWNDPSCGMHMKQLVQADELLQGDRGVIIMLCGTAGTGKSTLASLLGQRLGIPMILSTDSIRHMLRGFVSAEEDPVMHASTYESGAAVLKLRPDLAREPVRRLVKIGYKAQSSVVVSHLETLVAMWHASGRSAIVEGVHLHLKAVIRLMQKYPSILPFLVYIRKEEKHAQRMAVRAKYMTSDPAKNKYVRNIRNIRAIQEYLLRTADKVAIPKLANANVDVSVAAIHRTVLNVLRRLSDGEALLDGHGQAAVLLEEYASIQASQKQAQARAKGMRERVQKLLQSSGTIRALSGALPPLADLASSVLDEEVDSSTQHTARLTPPRKRSSGSLSFVPSDGGPVSADGRSLRANGCDGASSRSSAGSECGTAAAGPASAAVPQRLCDTVTTLVAAQARPEGVRDSSSESEEHTRHDDTHDEDSDDHLLVHSSNFSVTEIGSLCDSTELDDDDMLAGLWAVLLPGSGAWRDAAEPKRSARLCQALAAHLSGARTPGHHLPQRSRSVQPLLRASAPMTPHPPLRSTTMSHTIGRRSGENARLRRSSIGSHPVSSPAATPPGCASPISSRSPARQPLPNRSPAPQRVDLRPNTSPIPAATLASAPGNAPTPSTPSMELRSPGMYAQISDDLGTLLSGSPVRHPSALSSLRSVSMQLTPRYPAMSASMRSRSALALAAVAEDPGPRGGRAAAAAQPQLRQLTPRELSMLRRRRIMHGLLSWRHQSSTAQTCRNGSRLTAPLDSHWRRAHLCPGSDASIGSPRSAVSAERVDDAAPPLTSAHSWAGVCTERHADGCESAAGDAAMNTCTPSDGKCEPNGGSEDWGRFGRGLSRAGSCLDDQVSETMEASQHGPLSRLQSCTSQSRLRPQEGERSGVGTVMADEGQAMPVVHALLTRVVHHWGALMGSTRVSE